jgi:hypothetical protein
LNTNISATEKVAAGAKSVVAAATEKVRKTRKGSAGQETTSCRFYIGEVKDGLPVLSKEVSEAEALVESFMTKRPFMTVQMWATDQQPEDGRVVLMKVPAVGK